MSDAARTAREAFEERWRDGDRWDIEGAELDAASHARQLELLADRRYRRALEVGCGAGEFTRLLAGIADRVLALDIAPTAIELARGNVPPNVELRVANIMELDAEAEGPLDAVVMSETIYCLGWLYPLFELGWLAERVLAGLTPGGRFLMANTYGRERDYLLRPWLIDTYRDLFCNVGFRLAHDETLRGEKGGAEFTVLVSLFEKS